MAWFKENRPYLYADRRFWAEVDKDVKDLGIANYDPKLLDVCVKSLEDGKDVERSTRLLERYTGEKYAKPAEWRAWLTASRPDLFFSDVGGYRFFCKAGHDVGHRRGALAAAIEEPTAENPVSLSASIHPAVADGWRHLHARGADETGARLAHLCRSRQG